jgi:ParB family transcriptional regulator, chromosome partitioning protein
MEKIIEIYTDKIDDPKDAMRSELDRDALFDLAENIKQNGLINPITVRPIQDRFEVVAGHRRLSACKIAGKIKIPCVVRELDDNQTFEIMAAENLERADVDPVDESIFITNYISKTNKSISEVAKSIKRSVAYVQSRLLVGQMPEYMQNYLKSKELKLGVALVLMDIDNEQTREVWTAQAVRDGANIAMAEYWVSDYKRQLLPGGIRSETPPTDYVAGTPQPVLFECAIDGEKYDCRLCKSVIIYEGNLDIFKEFVSAFRISPAEIN